MIDLPASFRERLLAAAREAAPAEACGLLLGRTGDGLWRADELVPAANVADDPLRHFEVDPAAMFACLRRLRGTGRELVGVYHSHPTGSPAPSATDAARAWDPNLVWVIVGGGGIRAWRPAPPGFAPVAIRWRDDADEEGA